MANDNDPMNDPAMAAFVNRNASFWAAECPSCGRLHWLHDSHFRDMRRVNDGGVHCTCGGTQWPGTSVRLVDVDVDLDD